MQGVVVGCLVLSLLVLCSSDGATWCGSITVSETNGQSQTEGLYKIQSSENISSCSNRPVWKSQLIDSWIYYSAADGAWYVADIICANTALTNGMRAISSVESPHLVPQGAWQENVGQSWRSSAARVQCYDDVIAGSCMQSETGDAYIGGAYVTTSGRVCRSWSSSNCQGFTDRNASAVVNFCRNPGYPEWCHRERPWCYYDSSSRQWEYCYIPLCDHVRDGCVSAIGLYSREIITDDQLTASSSASSQYAPSAARINSDSGFWMPAYNDYQPYLQVDLRSLYRLTGLRVQGSSRYRYAYGVTVFYSQDGWTWTAYSDDGSNPRQFGANHSPGTDVTHINFATPFTARQIAIHPKSYSRPALRIELFGCQVSNETATFTNVTHDIEANTFWGLSNSPYVIQRPITIRRGATLSIAAGVNVVFDGTNSGLTVAGCVNVGGVAGLEVQMTSSSPVSLLYRTVGWKGISVLYNLHSDCGSNVISDVKIIGAEAALSFVVGDVSLRNVEIVGCLTALSLPSDASLHLTNCKFYDNQFAVNAVNAGQVDISSCAFERNQNAVLLRGHLQRLDVEDSLFSRNTQALFVSASNRRTAIFVRRSKFDYNTLAMTAEQNAALSATIADCLFNSSRLVVNALRRSQMSSVVVANSTFQSSGVVIRASEASQRLNMSIVGCSFRRLLYEAVVSLSAASLHSVTLAGNIFHENSRAPCVEVDVPAVSSNISPGLISIVGNSFTSHSGANVIVVNDRVYHDMQLQRNVFQNPLCPFEVEVQSLWRSGYIVDASENWWGSTNRTYVAERVSDVFIDSKKAKVSITSMYSDPDMTQLDVFPDLRTWNVTDGKLVGGELDRNVTLPGSNSPYFVNKTIYIPTGFQLQLKENVTLHFAEQRGIIVEGMLLLEDSSVPVTLQTADGVGFWNGLHYINAPESVLNNAHINDASIGIQLVNSSLVVRNCTMNGNGGVQLTGTTPVSLTLDHAVFNTQFGNVIDASLLDACDLSVTNSRLSSSGLATKLRCRGHVNVRIVNSTMKSVRGEAVDIGANVSRATVEIESSSFNGHVQVRDFAYDLRLLNFTVTDSLFESNGGRCLTSNHYTCGEGGRATSATILLRDNEFRCRSKHVRLAWPRCNDTSVTLHRNSFHHNSFHHNNFYAAVELYLPNVPMIRVIENTFVELQGGALSLNLGAVDGVYSVVVDDNVFRAVGSEFLKFVVSVDCSAIDAARFPNVSLTRNDFYFNQASATVVTSCAGLFLTENVFVNPLATRDYVVRVPYEHSSTMFARLNYWNASTYDEIAERVYDYSDDEFRALVQVSPWYIDLNRTQTASGGNRFFKGPFEIGGLLESDVTLSSTEQPYRVTQNIFVPHGRTLVIEAGVTLLFIRGGITVEGELVTNGTESFPVVLQPAASAAERFRGIIVRQRRSDTSVVQSRLTHTLIKSASTGLTVEGLAPILDHVTVTECDNGGIAYRSRGWGLLTMLECNVSYNSHSQLSVESYTTTVAAVYLYRCVIEDSRYTAIQVNGEANLTVNSSSISAGYRAIRVSSWSEHGEEIWIPGSRVERSNVSVIVENTEIHATHYAVECSGRALDCRVANSRLAQFISCRNVRSCTVQHCTINSPPHSHALSMSADDVQTVIIDDNIITNKTMGQAFYASRCQSVQFTNNVIRENRGAFPLIRIESVAGKLNFTGNVIANNEPHLEDQGDDDEYYYHYSSNDNDAPAVIQLSNFQYAEVSMSQNQFDNPDAVRELSVNVRLPPTFVVDLGLNFWDRSNYSAVIQRVDCFYNDMDKSVINIWPIVLDASDFSVVLDKDAASDYFFDDGLGGDVTSDVTISRRAVPYLVERSIYVMQTATMVVEDGVELKFKPGRGIYARGGLIMNGTNTSKIVLSQAEFALWKRVIVEHFYVSGTSTKSKLKHLVINGSEDGLALTSVEAECNGVHVYGSRYGVVVSNATVSFSDCVFSSSPRFGAGINLSSPSKVVLTRCLIVGGQYGIISHSAQHWLKITDCTIRNITADAIHLEHSNTETTTPATLLLHRNLFSDNSRAVHVDHNVGIDILVEATDNVIESASVNAGNQENGISVSGFYINLEAVGTQAHVTLQGNTFRDLPHSAVNLSRCYGSPLLGNHSTVVIGNNLTRISQTAVVIQCADTAATLIQSNTFLQNIMNVGPSCLYISSGDVGNRSSIELRIDRNDFRENSGTNVGRIVKSGNPSLSPGGVSGLSEFVSNTLADNFPRDSAIYSEYPDLRMHFNTFSNQRARFELRAGFPADQVANCTFNWWGVSTEDGIATRIFDHSDLSSVGSVAYVPFLNFSLFSCAQLSDCSGHGSCIYHDTCLCDAGWSGSNCSAQSCADVYDCSGHGQCEGPNLCRCDSGWLQPDCSSASCIQQSNCSNRGVCSSPNVCVCPEQYAGSKCSQCASRRWGPQCRRCPACVHGLCNSDNGLCDCDGPNWSGALCDQCSPNYFGASCLPRFLPPALTFSAAPRYSGADVTISWQYDVPAISTCTVQSPQSTFSLTCNLSVTLNNLDSQGHYTLFVQASDEYGNAAQYRHTWFVDRSSPALRFITTPASATNGTFVFFLLACTDATPCTISCSLQLVDQSSVYSKCGASYSRRNLVNGEYLFSAFAVDAVGNIGHAVSYRFTVDVEPPVVDSIPNIMIRCGENYFPPAVQTPTYSDNIDKDLQITFFDRSTGNCQTLRTWAVQDRAGNVGQYNQTISFLDVVPPEVGASDELYIACSEVEKLNVPSYVITLLNVTSQCGRNITINAASHPPVSLCGVTLSRRWIIADDCGNEVQFPQTIYVLQPSNPLFPDNGQTNVELFQSVSWPNYPGSKTYRLYIWRHGDNRPDVPSAVTYYRVYRPVDAYPANTRMLWQIVYNVRGSYIPGPVWGFVTRAFADLTITDINIPTTAFSGSSLMVTWTVRNIGNVSTSLSTSRICDAIYIGRSEVFQNAVRRWRKCVQRYVDPNDGYQGSGSIQLPQDDVGHFYVFVEVDIYHNVDDFSRDNNVLRSPESMQVQLTPPPNLRVSLVSVTGNIFSGKMASGGWVVVNEGLGITGKANWNDAVYMSSDEHWDSTDTLLAVVPHSGVLASGSSYRVSTSSLQIPGGKYGNFSLIVRTDAYSEIFEGLDENDNARAIAINVILSPYPDLYVENVVAASPAYTGDLLLISAVVQNRGAGAPFESVWKDALIISSASRQVYYDERSVFDQYPLPGTSYAIEFRYIIPVLPNDEYRVCIVADVNNAVFEYNQKANNRRCTSVNMFERLPDLSVTSGRATVFENTTGNYLLYNVTVTNVGQGSFQRTSWIDGLFVTVSEALTGATPISTNVVRLSSIEDHSYITWNAAVYIPRVYFGEFSVIYVADYYGTVNDGNRSNNRLTLGSVRIRRRLSDLVLANVTVSRHVYAGSVASIEWLVVNNGNLSAEFEWKDEINLVLYGRLVSSLVFPAAVELLLPGGFYRKYANLTIPEDRAGPYRLTLSTGIGASSSLETNTANNMKTRDFIVSLPPSADLAVMTANYTIAVIKTSRLLTVKYIVSNKGNSMQTSANWTDEVLIDDGIGNAVMKSEVSQQKQLLSSEDYSASVSMVVPSAVRGYYQLYVRADISETLPEGTAESNNVLHWSKSVYIPPEPGAVLVVNCSTLPQNVTYLSGTTLSLKCEVRNEGHADIPLSSWTDALYVATRPHVTASQIISGGYLVSSMIQNRALVVNGSYVVNFVGDVPFLADTSQVAYAYVAADVNGRLELADSIYASSPFVIDTGPLPDLRVIPVNIPTYVQSGNVYNVSFMVLNSGNRTASGTWFDVVYFSEDNLLDPFDLALKSSERPSVLAVGQNYTQNLLVSIPYDLGMSSHYLIILVNAGTQLVESDNDNNIVVKLLTVISLPAVDLTVIDVVFSQANVTYWDNVRFGWYVINNGSLAVSGYRCDSVYLSADDIWDVTDSALTEPNCGPFSYTQRGGSQESTIAIVPPVAVGDYKTIVRTRSNVKDVNLVNNIGVSVANLSVSPPVIYLNEPKTVSMRTNQQLVFRLVDLLVGTAVTVMLKTDYQFAYHRLYVRHSSPPSTNIYDFASSKPGITKQVISIPFVKPGFYYVLIESGSSVVVPEHYDIVVLGRIAKFEIDSVFPTVISPVGSATLRIVGTLFGYRLHCCLVGSLNVTVVCSSDVDRFSPEEAYCTLRVSGLIDGNYSLTLQDQQKGEEVQLEAAVEVLHLALPGKAEIEIKGDAVVRLGSVAVANVVASNIGYSDIPNPILLLSCAQGVVAMPTLGNVGMSWSNRIIFLPFERNRPSSVIPPRTTYQVSFSFQASVDGKMPIIAGIVSDSILADIIAQWRDDLRPSDLPSDVWDQIWGNVQLCLGNAPNNLYYRLGHFISQHYLSTYTLGGIMTHLVEIADNTVPTFVLAQSVDVSDENLSDSVILALERTYSSSLTSRLTAGRFGRGWTSGLIDIKIVDQRRTILLIKGRQQYLFASTDSDNSVYWSSRLSGDQIVRNTSNLLYYQGSFIFTFDKSTGRLQHLTDSSGRDKIAVTYDADNKPERFIHTSGSQIRLQYDSHGYIANTELWKGGSVITNVSYSYSDDGYLLQVTDAVGITEYNYNDNGDLTVWKNGRGTRTTFTYDDKRWLNSALVYMDDTLVQSVLRQQSCDGSSTVTVLPTNVSSYYVHGFDGALIQTSTASGLPVHYVHDRRSDSVTVVVGDDVKLRQRYDNRTNTVGIVDANGDSTSLTFGKNGEIGSIGSTGKAAYYRVSYDADGTPLNLTYRDDTTDIMQYDAVGNLLKFTAQDGSVTTYEYDVNSLPTVKRTADATYRYAFNMRQQVSEINSPSGTTKVEYDADGLPSLVVYPDGTSLSYRHNKYLQRISLVSSNGYNVTYIYDQMHRLSTMVDGKGLVIVSFEYGSNSKLARKQMGNGMYTEYTHDDTLLQLSEVRNYAANGSLLSFFRYTYNEFGYRASMETDGDYVSYEYDAIGQLIAWNSTRKGYSSIQYDAEMNRASRTSSNSTNKYYSNSMLQYVRYGDVHNFTYDKRGNLVEKRTKLETETVVEKYVFDAEDRVIHIVTTKLSCNYSYNNFGTLSMKTCSDGSDVTYLVDPFGVFGSDIIAESSNGGQPVFTYYGLEFGLITSTHSDVIDAVYYLFDGDGSTVHTTDATGEVKSTYEYDPFGVQISGSRNDDNSFRYLAQYGIHTYNLTSDIVCMRSRLYDPEHGRFLSLDPLLYEGSPTNPYIYGNNNPLFYKDPSGRILPVIAAGALIGGIISGVSYVIQNGNQGTLAGFAGSVVNGAVSGAAVTTGAAIVGIGVGGAAVISTGISIAGGYTGSYLQSKIEGSEFSHTQGILSGLLNVFPTKMLGYQNSRVWWNKERFNVPAHKFRELISPFDRAGLSVWTTLTVGKIIGYTPAGVPYIIEWVVSRDPNDILGPAGYGDGNFIHPLLIMEFKIRFENQPNATAAAQKVTINCPINDNVDLSSFRLGSFGFGEFMLDTKFNSYFHQQLVDVQEQTGDFVFIQASLDVANSEAVWLFQSIDQMTGLPPTDPYAGFLPPNNGTTGQGYVTFRIGMKRDVADLSKIYENASIVFDENPPIHTPPIFYTVDRSSPTVVVNATQDSGGVLLQFDTSDTGSGTRNVDLFRVSDAEELSLFRVGINQSAVVLQNLPVNQPVRLAAVASDNVGNVGRIGTSDIFTVIIKTSCPNNCSGNGDCLPSGLCRCTSEYVGQDCRTKSYEVVEPPILEISYQNTTSVNMPLEIFVYARSVRELGHNETLGVKLYGFPSGTVFSKGHAVTDGVHLAATDFGVVMLTPPPQFVGILTGTAEAVHVSTVRSISRSIDVSINVVQLSTESDMTTVSDWTNISTLPNGWGPWSEFGPCSRICDPGVYQRFRTCFVPSQCVGDNVQLQLCNLNRSCRANPDEKMEGALLLLAKPDVIKMLGSLEMFFQWIVYSINSYCIANAQQCCYAILKRPAPWSVTDEVGFELTSPEFVNIASGYPLISDDTATVKVIARVNKEHVERQCVDELSGVRSRRAANEVYLNKTLLTEAIRHSLSNLQQNLSITVLSLSSASDEPVTTTTSSPTSPSSSVVLVAVIVGVLLFLVLVIILVAVLSWRCRKRRNSKLLARPERDVRMTRFSTSGDWQAAADSDNGGFTETTLENT